MDQIRLSDLSPTSEPKDPKQVIRDLLREQAEEDTDSSDGADPESNSSADSDDELKGPCGSPLSLDQLRQAGVSLPTSALQVMDLSEIPPGVRKVEWRYAPKSQRHRSRRKMPEGTFRRHTLLGPREAQRIHDMVPCFYQAGRAVHEHYYGMGNEQQREDLDLIMCDAAGDLDQFYSTLLAMQLDPEGFVK